MRFCSSLKITRLNAELFGNYGRVLSAYFQFAPDEFGSYWVCINIKRNPLARFVVRQMVLHGY